MKFRFTNTIYLLFLLSFFNITWSQNFGFNSISESFTIRGSVYDKETYKPYNNVNVSVNGFNFTTTGIDGTFTIKAKINDELQISHKDFETIYYTIKSKDRILIEVIAEDNNVVVSKTKQDIKAFNRLIDSADTYLKRDAEKSISFVSEALKQKITNKQRAEAHELLGDIYTYWKQPDLAISAYKTSLDNSELMSSKLKLGKAYLNNDNISESISIYKSIKTRRLSNYQKIIYYEGLGDAYLKAKKIIFSESNYREGLKLAKRYKIKDKEVDLNSKLAEAFSLDGQNLQAKGYYNNSLNLAEQQSTTRAIEEQVKVAEFNSNISDYDNEIQLRKKAIKGIEAISKDSIIPNTSPLSLQKQNYKIGNAYLLKNEAENAISYFEKSIKEAERSEDLVVKKDATRKLSEAYLNKGDTEKSLEILDDYKFIVDELYIQKEQEISQSARFTKNLLEQQNRITTLESSRALSESRYALSIEQAKRQQLIIYSLIGGLVLLLITGYFMAKYIKQQRVANNLLALKSLRSQMNPHFIFNALNSVNSFIATNNERTANKYLSDFSVLMRAVLENSEEELIPLQKEIELIQLYTKLEHFRFQDKFDYDISIDNVIDIDAYAIPPMLLQPYIENAVWHGLRYKTNKGQLNISIHQKNSAQLSIEISDNGIGRARSKILKTKHQKKQNSKGMSNIKKRVAIINTMYKDKVDVKVSNFSNEEDCGTKVVVTLNKN